MVWFSKETFGIVIQESIKYFCIECRRLDYAESSKKETREEAFLESKEKNLEKQEGRKLTEEKDGRRYLSSLARKSGETKASRQERWISACNANAY